MQGTGIKTLTSRKMFPRSLIVQLSVGNTSERLFKT